MKKNLLIIFVILICIVITGCSKKENQKDNVVGGWNIDLSEKEITMNKNAKAVFEKVAVKDYKLIALLGSQVVSGTNYMYLVSNGKNYNIMVVYSDLQGNATITKTRDFAVTKYVNNDIENDQGEVVGGWNVVIPSVGGKLDSDVQEAFVKAKKEIKNITYTPITLMAHQLVSGTNYAILCYGKTSDDKTGIYLVTLYEDLNGKSEITSSSYVNLADFNE